MWSHHFSLGRIHKKSRPHSLNVWQDTSLETGRRNVLLETIKMFKHSETLLQTHALPLFRDSPIEIYESIFRG